MGRTKTRKRGTNLVAGGTPRVNLLPPQELETRARQTLRQVWMKAFTAALLLVAMAAVVGLSATDGAHTELAAVAAESAELRTKLAQYSEGITVRSQVQKLEKLRAQAGSNDLDWGSLIAEIKSIVPKDVNLIALKATPGAAPVPGAAASAQVGLRGTLTFSATSPSAQAATIMRLRSVSGFIDVDAGPLSSDGPDGGFTFVTTFSADQTRYTRRFAETGIK